MTRLELITLLVARAHAHGFEFRRWYTTRLGLPWISADAALNLLDQQRRYYALLFSHEFACAFWKGGEDIVFTVPAQVYRRRMKDGVIATVERKPFQRRSGRKDAWMYHLKQMAAAEEPLRYMRRYLNIEDELMEDEPPAAEPKPTTPTKSKGGRPAKPLARPMPTDTPAFLRRPYNG